MEFVLIPTNTTGMVAKFEEGAVAALDPIAPFTKIVEDIFRVEEALFSSQGRRGGGSWKRLKEDTVLRKGGNTRILENTGTLRESLTVPGADYQVLEIHRTGFVFGTDRPFADVNNYGSAYNNRPARPIMKFTPTDVGRWTSWLAEHLMAPFK